jgi:hypothetical protein
MLRDFKQVQYTQKSRLASQLWSDIRKSDRLDRIDLDFAFLHPISSACAYVGTSPDSNTARDLSTTNALAESLGKEHAESLPQCDRPKAGCTPVNGTFSDGG